MALITCPNCGGKISDQAPQCPHCGHPMSPAGAKQPVQTSQYVQPTQYVQPMKPKKSKAPLIIGIVVGVLVAIISIFTAIITPLVGRYTEEAEKIMEEEAANKTANAQVAVFEDEWLPDLL